MRRVRIRAIDPAGAPHLAFRGDTIRYAFRTTSSWSSETVLAANGVAAIAIRPSSAVQLAIIDYTASMVRYARK